MTRFWDGRTDGQTDGVTRLLNQISPLATQVISMVIHHENNNLKMFLLMSHESVDVKLLFQHKNTIKQITVSNK